MNIAQIEDNLQKLIKSFSKETFIYDLLLAYGLPKSSITRLQKGNLNLSKVEGEISWKKKLFFKIIEDADLHESIDNLTKDTKTIKHNPRFIVVTDYQTLLAVDTKTQDTLDVEIKRLPKHYDFFLPWAGMEKSTHQNENPADVKAAERMAKLFDEIKSDNPNESPDFIHDLNVFLSRLLFCFFAEDTNIFEDNQFTNAVSSHTHQDGSGLNVYMEKLFHVLNTEQSKRQSLPVYLEAFPYVNGGLFAKEIQSPVFSRKSRLAIIDAGTLQWKDINPDIFGSMIQAVITPEHRGGLGMHYTSVPNIMKVIEPLFLNDLYDEFEKANDDRKKLNKLLHRIQKLKIFDPACGSGNFLIIAYKELKRLEMKIFKRAGMMALSNISLSQFYGIEIDDFAHEVAMLSLWLAEHQMNMEFLSEFGRTNPTLPLKQAGNIVSGNAVRVDWEEVCPKKGGDEIYILGNPPYLGYSVQSIDQKNDMTVVLAEVNGYKSLDYIACWFYKGASFIKNVNAQFAFVSTNSICQGEQVSLLWPHIFKLSLEIGFAHQSFKWTNNAKSNAGVICAIVGVRNQSNRPKQLFSNKLSVSSSNISPYLTNGTNSFVTKRNTSISWLPDIGYGSSALDGGHLILSPEEKNILISQYPKTERILKKIIGSQELIKGIERWCLWIEDSEKDEMLKIPPIKERSEQVEIFRKKSKRKPTVKASKTPYKFGEPRFTKGSLIVMPKVSSERRTYIPLGYFDSDVIVMDKAFPFYNVEPFLFGILSSLMHMVWIRTVAGRLKSDYSYSSSLCYNTFPFPPISKQRKEEITQSVFRVLEEREKYSEKTLAQLYDPDKMPEGLKEAHRLNDLAVERCYRSKPFESDEERIEYLFKLYEKMIIEEREKDTTIFENKKKTRKKKK